MAKSCSYIEIEYENNTDLGLLTKQEVLNIPIKFWSSDNYFINSDFSISHGVNTGETTGITLTRSLKYDSSQNKTITCILNNSSEHKLYCHICTVTIIITPENFTTGKHILRLGINMTRETHHNKRIYETLYISFDTFNTSSPVGINTKIPNKIALGSTVLSEELPIGTIVMFYGNNISTLPNNWKICDGNNGTPNLMNKIIVGTTINNYCSGGNHSITNTYLLNKDQLPYHNHKYNVIIPRLQGEDRQDNQSGNLKNHGVSTIDSVNDGSNIPTNGFTYTTNEIDYYQTSLPIPNYQTLIFIMKIA